MSSSGKGQSIVYQKEEVESAWEDAQTGGRTKDISEVIVEELIEFDYEITLLTVRHKDGVSFCEPIGHVQESGDYQQSWQPHSMPNPCLKQLSASQIALTPLCAELMAAVFSVWSYS